MGSCNVTLLLEHDCSVEVAVVPHPELGSSVLQEDCVLVTTYWFVGWNTGGVEYNIGALRVELSFSWHIEAAYNSTRNGRTTCSWSSLNQFFCNGLSSRFLFPACDFLNLVLLMPL